MKEAWTNRKHLPKRDHIIAKIYTELMRVAEGPTYIKLRILIDLCILTVIKIRIN